MGAVLAAEIEKIPEKSATEALPCDAAALQRQVYWQCAPSAKEQSSVSPLPISRPSTATAVLDIPPSIVKNRRPIQGPLPDVPWLHRIIAIYTKSARPLLVNNQPDEGILVHHLWRMRLPRFPQVLYNDIRQILGVNPHAMRYVLATDGKRRHLSDEEIAEVLCHTPEMTRHISSEDRRGGSQ